MNVRRHPGQGPVVPRPAAGLAGLVLLAASLVLPGLGSRAQAEPAYVSLTRWASLHRLKTVAKTPAGELILSNRWSSLSFRKDNRRAVINDTVVWLAEPIRERDNELLVSQTDLDKTLRPLIKPAHLAADSRIRTIALSPGHGGKDNGNNVGRHNEKDYNLKLGFELERLLLRAGFKVILIRSRDEFIDLTERPLRALRRGADLLISLHYNSYEGPGSETARGVETFCLAPPNTVASNDAGNHRWPWLPGNRVDSENVLLAYKLQQAIVAHTGHEDRGVKRAHFVELAQAHIPAALIEGGFMTNSDDALTIFNPSGRRRLAEAIVDGILAYKRTVERARP